MERAAVPDSPSARPAFRDGLGERRHIVDPAGHNTLEQLCLRRELAAVPSFEFALRERVSRFAAFRHEQFARARTVERLSDRESTLAVVSERANGVRLSELLQNTEQRRLGLDITAALCLIRQLVPSVAALHESAREIAHGVIGPERLVVTPDGRLVVVEYVLGAALEQLRYTRERYWSELRVALPSSAGLPRFDQRADVTQIGVVALSLILGRPMRDDEFPARLADVVASTWAVSPKGGFEPLPPGLRGWLSRALQLDARNGFNSAVEARAELDKVLDERGDYIASPDNLTAFLARYHGMTPQAPIARAPLTPVPSVAVAPARPESASSEGAARPLATVMPPRGTAAAASLNAATPPLGSPIPASLAAAKKPAATPTPSHGIPDARAASAYTPPLGTPMPAAASPRPSPAGATPPRGISVPATLNSIDVTPPRGMPIATPAAPLEIQSFADSVVPTVMTPPRGVPIPASAAAPVRRAPSVRKPPMHEPSPSVSSLPRDDDEPRNWPKLAALAGVLVALLMVGAFAGWVYLKPAPAVVTNGTLVVTTNPSGAQALVDGRARGVTPLTLELPAGPHKLELRTAGGARTIPITIIAGAQAAQYIELPQEPSGFGQLQIRTTPPGARVTVDGIARGTSPITVPQLTSGEHAVLVESDLGSMKQTVTIEPGTTAQLLMPLSAPDGAPVSGWIAVSAPLELQLYEGDRLLGSSRSDRIMVAAGRHDIDIVNETFGYRATRSVQVSAGKVASIVAEMPSGTIALNAAPWAEVWIDGAKVGETPIGNHPLTIGTHDVVFRHPELGEQQHTATVTLKDVARLSVDLRKK